MKMVKTIVSVWSSKLTANSMLNGAPRVSLRRYIVGLSTGNEPFGERSATGPCSLVLGACLENCGFEL